MKPISKVSQQLRSAFEQFKQTVLVVIPKQAKAIVVNRKTCLQAREEVENAQTVLKEIRRCAAQPDRVSDLVVLAQRHARTIDTSLEKALRASKAVRAFTEDMNLATSKLLLAADEEPDWKIIAHGEDIRQRAASGDTPQGIAEALELPLILVEVVIATTPASEAA